MIFGFELNFDRNSMKVLLVEDDTVQMKALTRILNKHANIEEIYYAFDGLDGLERLKQRNDIDLIFTDYYMPNLDGLGFIREVAANPKTKDIPIIILSSTTDPNCFVEAIAAGAHFDICKPYTTKDILDAVNYVAKENLDKIEEKGQRRDRRRTDVKEYKEILFERPENGETIPFLIIDESDEGLGCLNYLSIGVKNIPEKGEKLISQNQHYSIQWVKKLDYNIHRFGMKILQATH